MVKTYLKSLLNSCLAGALVINLGANSLLTSIWDGVVGKTTEISLAGTVEPIKIKVKVTCYSNVPEQTDDTPDYTANGERVYWGGAAANFLEFGTEVVIPELFPRMTFKINDRMNSRYTKEKKRPHRIDVFMPDNSKAKKCGQVETYAIVLN